MSDYASLIEPTSYQPARTVIAVGELPAGALVQIDAVMSNAESTPPQV
jgi:enamine deaminase RidA (YjgF/YER057c/UK114 family)